MLKVNPIVQDMYDALKKVGAEKGIEFKKLELASVAREMGLLEQIELNFPSKEVTELIHVQHPDPENPTRMVSAVVEHVSHVMMTDEEVVEYRKEQALELLAAHYGVTVEELQALAAGPVPKPKAPKGKPAAKPAKPGAPKDKPKSNKK